MPIKGDQDNDFEEGGKTERRKFVQASQQIIKVKRSLSIKGELTVCEAPSERLW